MRNKNVWKEVTAVLLTVSLVFSGTVFNGSSAQAAKKLSINKNSLTLQKGQSKTLKIKNLGKNQKVTWKSNKKAVATVTKKGKVTGKKVGTATITAKVAKQSFKCKVTVRKKNTVIPTAAPDETAAPNETVTPDETAAPNETVAPNEAATPDETAAPDETVTPDETAVPVPPVVDTEEPAGTTTPEFPQISTPEPELTPEPTVSAPPVDTEEPAPTVQPTVQPIPTPTTVPAEDPTETPIAASGQIAVSGKTITIGMNADELISVFGNPDRTDATAYGFSYYVYNSDYSNLLMVAVDQNKVVGWYTDAQSFSYDGLAEGMSYSSVKDVYSDISSLDEFMTVRKDGLKITLYFDAIGTNNLLGVRVFSDSYAIGTYNETILGAISREVFDITNAYRAKNGLTAFIWSDLAEQSALLHSQDMAENNYFDHTSLDGRSLADRMTAVGITWRSLAENIIAGYSDASDAACGWYNSLGHRTNMLSDNTYLGVGFAYYSASKYGIYGTQNFYK